MADNAHSISVTPPPLPGDRRLGTGWVVAVCVGGTLVLSVLLLFGVWAGGEFDERSGSESEAATGDGVVTEQPKQEPAVDGRGSGQTPKTEDERADDDRDEQKTEKHRSQKLVDDVRGEDGRDALAGIKELNNVLTLPAHGSGGLLGAKPKKRMLVTIQTNALADCELDLVPRVVAVDGADYEIVTDEAQNNGLRRIWQVQRRQQNGGGLKNKSTVSVTIAAFYLVIVPTGEVPDQMEQRLYFAWDERVRPRWASEFRELELAVRVGLDAEVCSFNPVVNFAPISIRFGKRRELAPDLSAIHSRLKAAETEDLFVDFEPEGFPETASLVINRDGKAARRALNEARELLRGIPLWDLSVAGALKMAIVVASPENDDLVCVKVRVRYVPPGRSGHKGLSVDWECPVVESVGGSIRVRMVECLTIEAADRARLRMTVFETQCGRQLSDAKREIFRLDENLLRLRKKFDVRPDRLTEKQIDATVKLMRTAKVTMNQHDRNVRLLMKYKEIPTRVLAVMVQLHEKRATVGWRIYEKRGGRRINLAAGL